MEFRDLVKKRRSIRTLQAADVDKEDIKDIIKLAQYVPSPMNIQVARAILATDKAHIKVWETVLAKVIPLTKKENLMRTKQKIAGFKAGSGTLLIYLDKGAMTTLQQKYPLYAENMPQYALEEIGMFQYVIWLGLVERGYSASLQHYNPLIDDELAKAFHVPRDWQLISQIPFGLANEAINSRNLMDIDLIFKAFSE